MKLFNTFKKRYYGLKYLYTNLNLELKILFWTIVAVIVFIAISNLSIMRSFFFSNNLDNTGQVVSTNAKIIATIFAITISLTLLGFQYLSQNISPKILYSFFKSKFITIMIIVYIFSIVFNIFVLTFLEGVIYGYFSFLLLSFCVLYLVSYLYYIINYLQPRSIIKRIEKEISKTTYIDENYEILEQVIIKSIRNNEAFSYKESLDLLFDRQSNFLKKLFDKPITDYDTRHSDAERIVYYFFRYENSFYFEIIKQKNQTFLVYYLSKLKDLHVILLQLMAIRPYREIRDHFNDIGEDIVELKLKGATDYYSRSLREISKEEFNNIPSGNTFFEFQDHPKFYKELNKNEKTKNTLGHIMYHYFQYDRLTFLVDLYKAAIGKKASNIVLFIKITLDDLLMLAIKKDDNKKMRMWLVNSLLNSLKTIHESSLEKKGDTEYFGFYQLHNIIEDLKDEETINTVGTLIADYYCHSKIETVKNDERGAIFKAIFNLGVDGRSLVYKNGFDKIVDKIVDTLGTILKISIKNNKLKKISRDSVARELFSIRDWNSHKNKKIKERINKIIKEHNLKLKK